MANFRKINDAVRTEFPALDIEAVRGDGYIYFDGDDGFDKVPSIWANPPSLNTVTATRMVFEAISAHQSGAGF